MLTIPEEWIEGCRRQERSAQEQLYKRCYEPYLRLCLRYAGNRDDAADILNKAFFNILTRIDQYRGDGNFAGWMKRIVVNAALDFVRANSRFRGHEPVEKAGEVPEPSLSDQHLLGQDILNLLQRLPYTSATVFNLFALEGFSHREIAEALGISEGNSKWHLHHARQLLQQHLNSTAAL